MMLDLPEDLRTTAEHLRVSATAARGPGPECLDDNALAAVVDGRLSADSEAPAMVHLASCERCQRAVAAIAGALADSGVAGEISALEGTGRRRFYRLVIPLAAAAALLVVVWPHVTNPPHRAPPVQGTTAPMPLSPVGIVAEAKLLRWTAVSGADHYRITLSDAAGVVLYEQQVTDTEMVLPDSIHLVPARSYAWMVEARTGFDRWSASRLTEFTIEGSPP
jgi:hypothetical protein